MKYLSSINLVLFYYGMELAETINEQVLGLRELSGSVSHNNNNSNAVVVGGETTSSAETYAAVLLHVLLCTHPCIKYAKILRRMTMALHFRIVHEDLACNEGIRKFECGNVVHPILRRLIGGVPKLKTVHTLSLVNATLHPALLAGFGDAQRNSSVRCLELIQNDLCDNDFIVAVC